MKNIRVRIAANWRLLLAGLGAVLLASCLLGFRLGSLNKGASLPEVSYINSVNSGKKLLADPMFLVHKLPIYGLAKLGLNSIWEYRLVSAAFAALAVLSLFIFLKLAYTKRVAVLGTALFLTSSWLLHIGRSATPEASFLLLMPLLLVATWLHLTKRHYYSLVILAVVLAVSFYIPGFLWLTLTVVVWERKPILAALKSVKWWLGVICAVLVVLMLLPLIWATLHTPGILLTAAGLPRHIPELSGFGRNLLNVPKNLFVYGPADPVRWLGRLPILDIFSTVMLLLGIYSLRYHARQHDDQILAGSSIIILLLCIGGITTITALIPLLYIYIGAGIAFMLQQWMTVFPRNPVARGLATVLMSATVLVVCYYHINQYFIAWPQTPSTRHVYGHNLVK